MARTNPPITPTCTHRTVSSRVPVLFTNNGWRGDLVARPSDCRRTPAQRVSMETFDYIIVGAGSAGCVLANRLSADAETRVLLLEAGGRDRSPNIKIPAAFAKQFHTKLDWDFATEPEPHVDGRSLYIPRGKALGGSSSMNAMLYVRGRPLDYDAWAAQGAPGWGYQDVLPYFIRSEDNVRGRLGVARRRRAAAGLRAAVAPPAGAPPDRRQRRGGNPMDRRLQRARAGRRGDVPGHPVPGPALLERRRLLAPRAQAAQPGAGHPGHRARRGARGHACRGREGPHRAQAQRGAAGRPRGHPQRRRHRLSPASAGVGDRRSRRTARGRGGRPPCAAGRWRQPAGPPVRHGHLGGLGHRHPAGGRAAEVPGRMAAAPLGTAHLHRGRGGGLSSHAGRSARGRHPVPHGRRLLRGPRRRDLRRTRDGHRPGARFAGGAWPGVAALVRSDRQAADSHQHPVGARGPGLAGRRSQAGARDRPPAGRRPRSSPRSSSRVPTPSTTPTSRPTSAGA